MSQMKISFLNLVCVLSVLICISDKKYDVTRCDVTVEIQYILVNLYFQSPAEQKIIKKMTVTPYVPSMYSNNKIASEL